MKMQQSLLSGGVLSLFFMPEHLLYCRPFVAKSFPRAGRLDEDAEDGEELFLSDEDSGGGSQSRGVHEYEDGAVWSAEGAPNSSILVRSDRPRPFVIDDSPDQALSVFYATNQVRAPGLAGLESQRQKAVAVAVAVRERRTDKFSKVLRFVHNLTELMSRLINTWIASPRQ
jgi:hypothetical protein